MNTRTWFLFYLPILLLIQVAPTHGEEASLEEAENLFFSLNYILGEEKGEIRFAGIKGHDQISVESLISTESPILIRFNGKPISTKSGNLLEFQMSLSYPFQVSGKIQYRDVGIVSSFNFELGQEFPLLDAKWGKFSLIIDDKS